MFFIMGINNGKKKLDFTQHILCPCCGRASKIEVIMTFKYFMLFFVPLFKWNKRFFVTMPCCGATCELDFDLGRDLEKGRTDHIDPEDLNFSGTNYGGSYNNGYYYDEDRETARTEGPISKRANMSTTATMPNYANSYVDEDGLRRVKIKTCDKCGFETDDEYYFCPKCGNPL